MDLPEWNQLKSHYPALTAATVFATIGGKVKLNYDIDIFTNACAIRISKALNTVGGAHLIPFFKAISPNGKLEPQVSSGKNKMWYIFRVKMLVKYLSTHYSPPEMFPPSTYKDNLKDRKGIIVFEVSGWSDATGHADLWDGNDCLWQEYGGHSNNILFWEAA